MAMRPEGTTSDRLATRDVLLFTALCLVWGLTWIPIKIGTAAMYAFLSPIVAVIAGAVALNETVIAKDSLGMGLMLIGAMIALSIGQSYPLGRSSPISALSKIFHGDIATLYN